MIFFLLSCGPSLAAPISSSFTCVQGYETQATTKLQSLATESISNFFKDRKIEIDKPTVEFTVSLTIQNDIGGRPYVAFTGNSGGIGSSASVAAGTVTAKDGTKFNVVFSSGSDEQTTGEYRIISSQKGFDREGNALNRHCRLELFSSGDSEATKTLLVLNAKSAHVLGLIPLPRRIEVY